MIWQTENPQTTFSGGGDSFFFQQHNVFVVNLCVPLFCGNSVGETTLPWKWSGLWSAACSFTSSSCHRSASSWLSHSPWCRASAARPRGCWGTCSTPQCSTSQAPDDDLNFSNLEMYKWFHLYTLELQTGKGSIWRIPEGPLRLHFESHWAWWSNFRLVHQEFHGAQLRGSSYQNNWEFVLAHC